MLPLAVPDIVEFGNEQAEIVMVLQSVAVQPVPVLTVTQTVLVPVLAQLKFIEFDELLPDPPPVFQVYVAPDTAGVVNTYPKPVLPVEGLVILAVGVLHG